MIQTSVRDPWNKAMKEHDAHRFACPQCSNGWTFRPDGSVSGYSSSGVDRSRPFGECPEGERLHKVVTRALDALTIHSRKVNDLPGMGYWTTERAERKTEAPSHILKMTPDEREAILAYMEAADYGIEWRGSSACCFCGEMLGSHCQVTPDFKWKFPERWEHYIIGHGVRPFPEAFIKDALDWVNR